MDYMNLARIAAVVARRRLKKAPHEVSFADIEDARQAAAMRVYEVDQSLRDVENREGYLFRVAVNAAIRSLCHTLYHEPANDHKGFMLGKFGRTQRLAGEIAEAIAAPEPEEWGDPSESTISLRITVTNDGPAGATWLLFEQPNNGWFSQIEYNWLHQIFLKARKCTGGSRAAFAAHRDCCIAALVMAGYKNSQIAELLGTSGENIKTYRKQIKSILKEVLNGNQTL